MVKYMMQETYRHGFICEGYVTVIFMYKISTVHNPDRQNYLFRSARQDEQCLLSGIQAED